MQHVGYIKIILTFINLKVNNIYLLAYLSTSHCSYLIFKAFQFVSLRTSEQFIFKSYFDGQIAKDPKFEFYLDFSHFS